MPQLGFLQVIIFGAGLAFVLVLASMLVGSKAGRSAGTRMLWMALAAYGLFSVSAVLQARSNGQAALFQASLGSDGALQIGVFILIVLFTASRLALRYLGDLER